MNEDIILKMVQPYLKDNTITYREFDNIFEFLSLKEQYVVVEILFSKGILLVEDDTNSELESVNVDEEVVINDTEIDELDDFEILYDEDIFKDKNNSDDNVVYYKDVRQSNDMLCMLIQEGNMQARQDICVKNKLLVDKYVNAYLRYFGNHLDFEDLEQVGFIGLLKAAEKYDIRRDSAFSTYAVFWIKQSIVREVMDNGFVIRVPVHVMEQIGKMTRLDNEYSFKGYDFNERIVLVASDMQIPEEKVQYLLGVRQHYLSYSSLNTPVGEEEDTELEDLYYDKSQELIEDVVSSTMLREQLVEVFSTLTEREQKVLRLRYGLDDGRNRTLEEVGKEFNVTRERIRQVEAKALRKLRHPARSRKLRDYLD
ncbi:MAG: sigma-70 family RNA polymerase sigma factor [Lachnospiraceae bacterium]|nr:sigma-70 family RNA polymerase sigma factor [Lachnospiraceae bacterium]